MKCGLHIYYPSLFLYLHKVKKNGTDCPGNANSTFQTVPKLPSHTQVRARAAKAMDKKKLGMRISSVMRNWSYGLLYAHGCGTNKGTLLFWWGESVCNRQ